MYKRFYIAAVIRSRIIRWLGHVSRGEDMSMDGKTRGKMSLTKEKMGGYRGMWRQAVSEAKDHMGMNGYRKSHLTNYATMHLVIGLT